MDKIEALILSILIVFTITITERQIKLSKRIDAIEENISQQIILRHVDEDREESDIKMSREREDKLLETVKELSYEVDVLTETFRNQK